MGYLKPRKCADCGRSGRSYLPQGDYVCHTCRRARPEYTGSGQNSHGASHANCKMCGERKAISSGSRKPGEMTCRECRREARDNAAPIVPIIDATTRRPDRKLSATKRGLGYAHQLRVRELKRNHVDGSPCEWCGRPMYLDPTLNWDYDPTRNQMTGQLQGDHSLPRSRYTNSIADRLLHRSCNSQRGDGSNDHLAWVNHRTDPTWRNEKHCETA